MGVEKRDSPGHSYVISVERRLRSRKVAARSLFSENINNNNVFIDVNNTENFV